jgi:acetoacetyl-CoA synthetase
MPARSTLPADASTPIWTPPADVRDRTAIGRYLQWLEHTHRRSFGDYDELWRWSVDDQAGFWESIWQFFEVRTHAPYTRVLESAAMPGTRWFDGALVNYAEHLFGDAADDERVALVAHSQTRPIVELTVAELVDQVGRARAGLERLGVGRGDRVVGYLPNAPETLIAFAATASLGAVWASCAPELGARAVIDRLALLAPKVLITVAGYGFRDRMIDRRTEVAAIRSKLPSLRHVVHLPYGPFAVPASMTWEALTAEAAPLAFEAVPFDHPLYVLFSSGTTGPPKAIVHGHGGILLEHLKSHALSWNVEPGGRLLWFTTTSWMMWNALVSALLLRASIVMVDGDPTWPQLDRQWRIAATTRPSVMGASPAFVMACRRAGIAPGEDFDLSSIRVFATAGSPLPAEGYKWLYDQLGPEMLLINGLGGTDVCSAIVGGGPLQAVYAGEISGRCLGVAADAFDSDGNAVLGELGELVITRPMPSMPIGLWGDEGGSRYRDAYFSTFPGIWRQGDWIRFTTRGTCVATGRSDATLNRAGVRLGTGEFYGVIEELPEVLDSVVIHLEDDAGGPGELLLFVALVPDAALDDRLRTAIVDALRTQLSPRHVPDRIVRIKAVPRTLTGKKLETPLKRILLGTPPELAASVDGLLDPSALDEFVAYAATRRQ